MEDKGARILVTIVLVLVGLIAGSQLTHWETRKNHIRDCAGRLETCCVVSPILR